VGQLVPQFPVDEPCYRLVQLTAPGLDRRDLNGRVLFRSLVMRSFTHGIVGPHDVALTMSEAGPAASFSPRMRPTAIPGYRCNTAINSSWLRTVPYTLIGRSEETPSCTSCSVSSRNWTG